MLVADDQCVLTPVDGLVHVSPPARLAGLMEMRGIGLVPMPYLVQAALYLVIDLVGRDEVPRLPDPRRITLEGIPVNALSLHAFDASTPIKILTALGHMP